MDKVIINLTDKQEKQLYIRAINGSEINQDIEKYCKEYLYFEESSNCYGWLWDIDKLNNLSIIMLRGIYWGIHSDEL